MPIDAPERIRRRELVRAHLAAENQHDLDRVMSTFAAKSEMIYNRDSFTDHNDIRNAHIYIGMSATADAISALEVITDVESFTDDDIVIEGRLCGKHVGEFRGYAPTQREVELPFVTFYRFDPDGKLTSERVVMRFCIRLNRSALSSKAAARLFVDTLIGLTRFPKASTNLTSGGWRKPSPMSRPWASASKSLVSS